MPRKAKEQTSEAAAPAEEQTAEAAVAIADPDPVPDGATPIPDQPAIDPAPAAPDPDPVPPVEDAPTTIPMRYEGEPYDGTVAFGEDIFDVSAGVANIPEEFFERAIGAGFRAEAVSGAPTIEDGDERHSDPLAGSRTVETLGAGTVGQE